MPQLSIDQAAEFLGCTADDVLHEIRLGKLIPSIYLGPMRGFFWEASSPPYIYRGKDEGWDWDGDRTTKEQQCTTSDHWYIPTCAHQDIYPDANDRFYIHLQESFLSLQGHTNQWFGPEELIEREGDKIYLDELVIDTEELERFRENNEIATTEDNLSTRERDNLLSTIAVLVRMYVDARGAQILGKADKPNIYQVSEDILAHIRKHRISPIGLGGSTLRGRISEALDSLDIMPTARKQ